MEVIIDGVRYVPVELPDDVHFYYMHDNHTFSPLRGTTLDAVIARANHLEQVSPWGMLCGPILLRGTKEVRRVNVDAHSHGRQQPAKWAADVEAWRHVVQADIDVMRLLPTNV